jgi:hypothetical protein
VVDGRSFVRLHHLSSAADAVESSCRRATDAYATAPRSIRITSVRTGPRGYILKCSQAIAARGSMQFYSCDLVTERLIVAAQCCSTCHAGCAAPQLAHVMNKQQLMTNLERISAGFIGHRVSTRACETLVVVNRCTYV